MANRIVYQDWIVALGRAPNRQHGEEAIEGLWSSQATEEAVGNEFPAANNISQAEVINRAVREALSQLPELERDFMERHYFMGESYQSIADKSGRAVHKLEAMDKRALRKLKKLLGPLAGRIFGIPLEQHADCLICSSPFRPEIDCLISARQKSATWKSLIKTLKDRFGINIRTPQVLIGHEKYHS